jgi:hypothetical protein
MITIAMISTDVSSVKLSTLMKAWIGGVERARDGGERGGNDDGDGLDFSARE